MNYNNSPTLFENARRSYRERGIDLTISEGHIFAGADGIVARFSNTCLAESCLLEAGYTQENNFWLP